MRCSGLKGYSLKTQESTIPSTMIDVGKLSKMLEAEFAPLLRSSNAQLHNMSFSRRAFNLYYYIAGQ